MNLTQITAAVNQHRSSFESLGDLIVDSLYILEDMTLQFKDLRSFYLYLAQVHILEPIFHGEKVTFIPADIASAFISLSWKNFKELSYINNEYTLEFKANTLEENPSINFIDLGLLGESNTYKPYGSTGSRSIRSNLTKDLMGIKTFFDTNFKFKLYRGTISFTASTIFEKGTIIDIEDKALYVLIIEFRVNFKTGTVSHTGMVLAKG